jgi:hypothetical protein
MVGPVTQEITPEVITELVIIGRPKFLVLSGRYERGSAGSRESRDMSMKI